MNLRSQSSEYCHPGRQFIQRYGVPTDRASVLRYPQFLRSAAGLTDEPPIHLLNIYRHFGMREPVRAPLEDQQGILVDGDRGLILVKEDDARARQRFTEGHELMELLFDAIEEMGKLDRWSHDEKERLCDQGAAELLMPRSRFIADLQAEGLSLRGGRSLSKLYQMSLIATLVQMINHSSDSAALVLWHPALRKQEQRTQPQMTADSDPPKWKLRVWWRRCTDNWTGGFIPPNKSAPSTSLITQSHLSQQTKVGIEVLPLSKPPIQCRVEALPIQTSGKSCVLTLLHSPESDLASR
ncbi:MAG: ImmA/IrrE family metallo-endopeptidase [Cyanothece sp. SIO2G6]|nr:ImmA/IrrE family metallo-endopeptidase [Cyanothece sp. SIO2G6]